MPATNQRAKNSCKKSQQMGNKRKLTSHENQIKWIRGEPCHFQRSKKKEKGELNEKKIKRGGNDDVLGTKLGSGSISIETKNKGSEMMMML